MEDWSQKKEMNKKGTFFAANVVVPTIKNCGPVQVRFTHSWFHAQRKTACGNFPTSKNDPPEGILRSGAHFLCELQ